MRPYRRLRSYLESRNEDIKIPFSMSNHDRRLVNRVQIFLLRNERLFLAMFPKKMTIPAMT